MNNKIILTLSLILFGSVSTATTIDKFQCKLIFNDLINNQTVSQDLKPTIEREVIVTNDKVYKITNGFYNYNFNLKNDNDRFWTNVRVDYSHAANAANNEGRENLCLKISTSYCAIEDIGDHDKCLVLMKGCLKSNKPEMWRKVGLDHAGRPLFTKTHFSLKDNFRNKKQEVVGDFKIDCNYLGTRY